jgi:hypothetical protein
MINATKDIKDLWQTEWVNTSVFSELEQIFNLARHISWPSRRWITEKYAEKQGGKLVFTDSKEFDFNDASYEEIIFQYKQVPTRATNWHDLFNGLIWCLFGKTKSLLNQQHIEDIQRSGLHPRTPRRNRITHFDECGVVIAYTNNTIPHLLSEHQWMNAFYDCREKWDAEVKAFIFGHANYEMLLNPFIGLTGKWLGVQVDKGFFALDGATQYQALDDKLVQKIGQDDTFSHAKMLSPLPLLGVPNWYPENVQRDFYLNQEYFRPKPAYKR